MHSAISTSKQPNRTQNLSIRSPSPNYAAWLDQDVRWIITDEERASFKRLRSDEEREQFIERFWLRRDPTPETFLNEFKQEHYRRMLYANEHFATADIPGWRTDRGRMYIVYGEADQVTSRMSETAYAEKPGGIDISEGIGQEVDIEFVDRCRCGKFVAGRRTSEQLKNAQNSDEWLRFDRFHRLPSRYSSGASISGIWTRLLLTKSA